MQTSRKISNELTQTQLQIWTSQKLSPQVPLYNTAFSFDFDGEIDVERFQKAYEIVVNESDIMRTVFYVENNIPKRKILENYSFETEVLDWSNQENAEQKVKQWINKRIEKNFDLSDVLFDSVLIKLKESEFIWYINQHHIITDAWSVSVLYRKVAEVYADLVDGNYLTNIELPKFEKFIEFEKNSCRKICGSQVEKYWEEKLKSIPKTPKLYGQINEESSTETTRTSIEIGKKRAEKLQKILKSNEINLLTSELTIFNIFLTILYAYLYRISGEEQIVIGSPSHNRVTKEFRNSLGVFVEFFPILSEVDKNDTFFTLFNRLKEETYNFLKNVKTGISNTELNKSFNVALNYFTTSFPDFNGVKSDVIWHHSKHYEPQNHFALEVYDFKKNGNFTLNFDIKNSVIPKEKQKDAIGHFMKMLDAFLDDYQKKINDIEIVSKGEQRQIFGFGNAIKDLEFESRTVLDVFRKQVLEHPQKIVVQYENKTLSFKDLDEKSNQLANYLIKLGIQTESRVGVFLERSTDLLISIFGILKAGGAYVPLDTIYPKERLKYILDDADISVIILQENLYGNLPENDCQIVKIDSDSELFSNESKINPNVKINPSDLAYVIYTSGSTGTPKGSMNEHRSVIQLVEKIKDDVYFQYEDSLNLSMVAPVVFDASILPIFASTLLGHKLVIAPEYARFDGKKLSEFYQKYEIDIADVTPAHLRLLLKSAKSLQMPRHFIIGGEALSSSLLEDFHNKFNVNDYIISNIYGVAECCVDSTGYDIKSGEKVNYSYIPIGKPLKYDRIYILNDLNQIQPIGTPGEICIGGTTVGRGYLNLEDFSRKKFVQNPFRPNERIFKTGDIGFFFPDGNIQYVGRKDNQVNLNGYRIELSEIESHLLAIKEGENNVIKDVVVVVKKKDKKEVLCAYFVANTELKVNELRTALLSFLPGYMIPNYFVQLEKLPLTTNGKIDKKSLPIPKVDPSIFENYFVAPTTEFEEIVAETWSEILEVPKIGIMDNFLDLGGNSLDAIRVMTRLNDKFELDLPLNLIFEQPTVKKLSASIENTILTMLEGLN